MRLEGLPQRIGPTIVFDQKRVFSQRMGILAPTMRQIAKFDCYVNFQQHANSCRHSSCGDLAIRPSRLSVADRKLVLVQLSGDDARRPVRMFLEGKCAVQLRGAIPDRDPGITKGTLAHHLSLTRSVVLQSARGGDVDVPV
jgi:hypothetical protein